MGFGSAASTAVQVGVQGDTQPRLQIDAGGKLNWGAGSTSAPDTTLYRSAADTLRTDDAFIASGGLTIKSFEVDTAGASSGQALIYNGTKFLPANVSASVAISDTPPTSPTTGQFWFESDTGKTFIYYDNTWVQLVGSGGGGGGGGASVTVSDTPPASPSTGAVWYESDTGSLYLYYDSFWVEVGGSASYNAIISVIQSKGDLLVGTGSQSLDRLAVGSNNQRLIADSTQTSGLRWAADTTNTVIDASGDLLVGASNDVVTRLPVGANGTVLTASSSATNGIAWANAPVGFRNTIINGDFRINQRGFSSTTGNGVYGFDRWRIDANGGTTTYSAQAFTPGNPISGQEPINFARVVTSGQTNTNGVYSLFRQPIEDVRIFAGQTVTVSFWAKAGSGTPKVAVELEQNFGSGGSAGVTQYAGQVTLSTSWQRFTLTTTIPSISGKTIGTSSHVLCTFILSGGPDWNARSGSIGIQSATFDFWGVQVEQNTVATSFEQRPIGVELALCQRYFQSLPVGSVWVYNRYWNVALSGGDQVLQVEWKTTMRTAPTVTTTAGSRVHSFNYVSYNTGAINYNVEETGTAVDGWYGALYSSTNNGNNNLPVGYTSGRNNNIMWVNAEL